MQRIVRCCVKHTTGQKEIDNISHGISQHCQWSAYRLSGKRQQGVVILLLSCTFKHINLKTMIDNESQPTKNFVLYTTPNGEVKLEVFIQDETLWLTQKAIATMLGVEVPAISKHLNNIYDSGELVKEATISILETVQKEGSILMHSELLEQFG
jgi:hypothetical protein